MLTTVLIMVVATAGVGTPSFAFGAECATKFEVVRPELRAIVAIENRGTLGTKHGDRAFQHDLDGDGKPELFLLLHCATTNCAWAIVEQDPFRDLGRAWAEVMYLVPTENSWPTILAVGRHGEWGWSSEYRSEGQAYVQDGVKNLAPREKQQLLRRMGPVRCN